MNAAADAVRKGARIGRFRLLDELGRGAQATVWRAHDERLDRDVALKLLDPGTDSAAASRWLQEARAVSRLAHPNLVPVFEADTHDGQPYLVFELVPGQTLAQQLRRQGAMVPRAAVELMLGVLDALRVAHEQGLVHRDLKPSNVLVDAEGRARVMDFGIAARAADEAGARAGGTPGYLSPEAAVGQPPSPAMDVFGAGLLLGELLAGRPLLHEPDARRAAQRVQHEDLQLPADVAVDDRLRAIVQRAIARDPAQRHDSAARMRDALADWLRPAADPAAGPTGASGTLDFLLRRMRHKTDFPALSDSMARIQRIANSDKESLNSLAGEILKDVALTQKVLRMVNSAHYGGVGGGTISTVSRAVAVIGFAGIRNMALSLVLLEHMKDKAHANRLKEEFLRSLMAGQLASELAASPRDHEEAFLGAMFHNLGRLLAEYYFPEEAQAIRDQLPAASDRSPPSPQQIEAAAERVLGLSFEALGLGVARSWGLPESLQRCMRRPEGDPPGRALERDAEQPRWLACAANEAADLVLHSPPEHLGGRLKALAERFGRALSITGQQLETAAEAARQKMAQLVPAMGLQLAPGAMAWRLLTPRDDADGDAPDSLLPYELHATDVSRDPAEPTAAPVVPQPASPERVAEMLAAGIQDITNTMAGEHFKLNEVLRMILETMYRALQFRRVVFCLRDPRSDSLQGRFGLGDDADRLTRLFQIALRPAAGAAPDLFTAVCQRSLDTLITDARQPKVLDRLPAWYRQQVHAPAFLLLPMSMKNAPFGLIYADKAQPGELALAERELALLRTLRNQAVMAFRQSS